LSGPNDAETAPNAHRTIDAVWRIESAALIAGLVRMLRDLDLAEEVAQDALLVALERWQESGIPDKPGAWLMTTAKRRAIDLLRRRHVRETKYEAMADAIGADLTTAHASDPGAQVDAIDDDMLRLVFIACHPVLAPESRAALTLRLLGGLTTDEIARAYLVPTPTIAQRIVRAKRTLSEARVPFEVPEGADRAARLGSVLEVLYLIFNEGYAATTGGDWMRITLCEEALRLGRVLAELVPAEPEVHGLVAGGGDLYPASPPDKRRYDNEQHCDHQDVLLRPVLQIHGVAAEKIYQNCKRDQNRERGNVRSTLFCVKGVHVQTVFVEAGRYERTH
jgi:RNA polymerase sigma factor (sigma-70 family)